MNYYENVLTVDQKNSIEKLLLKNNNFYWQLDKTLYGEEINKTLNFMNYFDCHQMIHQFIVNGNLFSNYTKTILDYMNWPVLCNKLNIPNNIWKMKTNLMFNLKSNKTNTPHVDSNKIHISMIYYVNDSDGETTIYNKIAGENLKDIKPVKKFKPKKGSFLIFDGSRYHSSKPPQNTELRCVINFNLLLENPSQYF